MKCIDSLSLINKRIITKSVQHFNYMQNVKAVLILINSFLFSASHCKRQWSILRDNFRRALRKKKELRLSHPGTRVKKWKFEDEMSFLLPHFRERETSASIKVELDCDSDGDFITSDSPTADSSEAYFESPQVQIEEQPGTSKRASEKSSKAENYSEVVVPQQSASMKYVLETEEKAKAEEVVHSLEDVDYFFLSLAATVKRFSPYHRAIAKAKLFSFVSELEIEDIKQKQYDTLLNSHHSSIGSQRSPYELPIQHTQSPRSTRIPSTSHVMSCESTSSFDPFSQSQAEK